MPPPNMRWKAFSQSPYGNTREEDPPEFVRGTSTAHWTVGRIVIEVTTKSSDGKERTKRTRQLLHK